MHFYQSSLFGCNMILILFPGADPTLHVGPNPDLVVGSRHCIVSAV